MTEEPRLPYIMPKLTSAGFRELAPLMSREEDFPRTFAEWAAFWDDRRREEEGNGYAVRFVDVVPEAFARWIKARNKPGSWVTLGEFLAAKAGR